MARKKRLAPRELSPEWPDVACADVAAEKVRLLALRVAGVMDGRSLRTVVAEVDLDHSIVSDLLTGRSWPEARTIALLEVALDAALWPPHESAE